ncbi:MAG: hypothetical protein ABS53_11585 [Hydrogenophaga sp. SCN 70-13]|uniref:hypothetical protein n=1 Tax=unclassified Hydrogenophaga TaxID=2610897 RepID=UPI00086F5171|nr:MULTISPECIES: hypothetical protein [unclassified Hydrogenophaga]MBN9371926.1 hypothetical protein [Hydrogenophaga sp.]ODT30786.1 MAG: hypothetical protein ABS53_11585 [Hydrogenophaga sp. SCN 70-13]OJV63571.1 MAG: hypothetical protein BGO22_11455 [Hydrogenophaga sp. 70-12]
MQPAPFTRLSLYGLLALAPVVGGAQSVRKLGDGELSCAQIYAESQALEQASEAQRADALQAQQAMTDIQNQMVQQASGARGGMGSAIGGGLLGLIPGGAQVQGYAMQAAAEARRADMQDSVDKMMQATTRQMNAEQALERTQARSEHLADLFLKKDCKLSQVKAGADRPQ